MSSLTTAMEKVFSNLLALDEQLPMVEYDSDWPSPCQQSEADDEGMIQWKPIKRESVAEFDDLESALELALHPDLKAYYGSYYSECVDGQTEQGGLQLLQAWNSDDFERLQQNIIGHVLMKRRLKQPITVFFAVTDEEDWFLSLDNDSGEVLLETPGKVPQTIVAPSLEAFLATITRVA